VREGTIIRALSGFYYVRSGEDTIVCRAKGRFRRDGVTPLVGDRVTVELSADGTGTVAALRRKYPLTRAVHVGARLAALTLQNAGSCCPEASQLLKD